jgi:hypothetical protein
MSNEPVLDTKVGFRQLHADPQMISYGGRSIALDQAEWVRYRSIRTTTKRHFGLVEWHDANWYFSAGPYPFARATMVDLEIVTHGKDSPPPDAWTFLVNLSRRYLEPRLVAGLAARVRHGETVNVGGLQVQGDGVGASRPAGLVRDARTGFLPWRSISRVRLAGGQVWIDQAGASESKFSAPLTNPNAVLIPALIAALTS